MTEPKSIHELNADLFQTEEVDRFNDPKEARKKAMDYLARREYAQTELIDKLARAGYDADIATEAVLRLTTDGLQNDGRFAESFAQSRISQGKGPVRIRQELKERGVSSSCIQDALREKAPDWFDLANDVRVRKFGAALPTEFSEKARQMRFLQYRGFEQEQIQFAVNKV